MIKEVFILKCFDEYREAMNYTKTIFEDCVLLTMHGENGKKVHGPISKVNIQEILNLFDERKEWKGLTDEDKREIIDETEPEDRGYVMALVEAKLKDKNA
jgi:hypothetical protein